ncbi:MAG: 8-amino-7-oxononanoate synthase [Marinilabiliaceae bacterium]|nr:8-amino-7-oxononanoate synthase [Marinilabiliaceae bacterium]
MQPLIDGYVILNEEKKLNLSSNDYLGLGTNEDLKREFQQLLNSHPEWHCYTASSSRMLSGNNELYEQVENALSIHYGKSALFFNSGYHANIGILPAITTKNDLILSDKLVHASLIDGIKLSSAKHVRYRHNDYDHLRKILKENRGRFDRVFIVTESIFSMDGDRCDLVELINIKHQFNVQLYVDEAHAVGAVGTKGLGICEELGVVDEVDLIIGTMGKALSSVGAFVICNESVKQWLINKARPFIYTTAMPPINLAWSLFIINKIPFCNIERQNLKTLWRNLGESLNAEGFNVNAESHIIPVVIGDNETTVKLSEHLLKKGFVVMPIRPPTVQVGTSRLRISLSASINWQDIKLLGLEIRNFTKSLG